MKIAITGKGGVGKTMLTAFLARVFSESGYSVIVIDADPDANLAMTLGCKGMEKIVPISEMKELIEERTETKPGERGTFFRLNPRVDDIPDKYSIKLDGIRLLVMGQIKKGGSGCYCPENSLLSALLTHLLITRDEVVIMDMAAGIEHLGRGTARSVDRLIIVVEPGRGSIETAHRIKKLALDIGIKDISIVGNKIHGQSDKDFILQNTEDFQFLGFIPFDQAIIDAEISGIPMINTASKAYDSIREIFKKFTTPINNN